MALKVALVFDAPRRFMNDPSGGLLPLGLLSMAAMLKARGHDVQVAHLSRYSRRDALRLLADGPPDLVGFSCFTFQRQRTLETARNLLEFIDGPKPFIVLGGPHATPLAQPILERCPWVDGVVCGEGEETLADIAEKLDKGEDPAGTAGFVARQRGQIVVGPERPLMDDLDRLPGIAGSDLILLGVNRRFQLRHLVTGRGCTARCSFCAAPGGSQGRVRRHSVDWVCREIEGLADRLGLTFLSFRDDTFTDDPQWTQELCRRILAGGRDLLWDCQSRVNALDDETVQLMRRAGCVQIQLGVESGSPRLRKQLGKPFSDERLEAAVTACRKVGMRVSFYLISGIPGEASADYEATRRLVETLKPASLVISRLVKFPGTQLSADTPDAEWFDRPEPEFPVVTGAQADKHDAALQGLADVTGEALPFTEAELKAASALLDHAPPAMLALGECYEDQGADDAAESIYQKILSERPGYVWAALNYADLLMAQDAFQQAIPLLKQLCGQVPNWPYPLSRLGEALVGIGQEKAGKDLLERARQMEF